VHLIPPRSCTPVRCAAVSFGRWPLLPLGSEDDNGEVLIRDSVARSRDACDRWAVASWLRTSALRLGKARMRRLVLRSVRPGPLVECLLSPLQRLL
jgi:hypothetical protein